ncbi:MAG: ParA family protein [Candidatus Omnitrophota bacterium]|nr:ParA family protein [Candidatus Omnitrophota bacterium]
MGKIFSICNQKGGVGKTTSAVNLATVIAQAGWRVLIIDMDAQGNATSGLGEDKETLESTSYQLIVDKVDPKTTVRRTQVERLDLIPANADFSGAELELINQSEREFVLRKQLGKISEDYDFILIDCPPSLGLITINCLTASKYIIIPLQCEYYALEGLGQLLRTHQLVKEKLNPDLEIGGVIMTMADFRTNLTQQVIEEVRSYFQEKVFETVIPRSVKLSEAPSFGKPAVIYDPQNRGSKSYRAVGQEFLQRYSKDLIISNDAHEALQENESQETPS